MIALFFSLMFHTFSFLTMKPSGFPLAQVNESTVQTFATAKMLLTLLRVRKDMEFMDLHCISH